LLTQDSANVKNGTFIKCFFLFSKTYFIHSFHFSSHFFLLFLIFFSLNFYYFFEFLADEWIANVKKIYEYGRLPVALALSLAFLAT